MTDTPSPVDKYLHKFDGEELVRLEKMRELILDEAPEATESISYGLVGYKLKGKPLVYFGGFAHHIGFYAIPHTHDAFKEEFSKYKQGRGSVQFPLNQPLPVALIKKVIKYRKQAILTDGKAS